MTKRRLGAVAVLLTFLAASTIARVPVAPKAGAAVHNLFPADADGFPTGRFRADEALFVTLTSDTFGGTVCIVPASVTDPGSADCVEPAWGDAKPYIGMGTLLGFPFFGGSNHMLRPGHWRLLAAPSQLPAESDLVTQADIRLHGEKRDPLKGNELSEPFEVVSCSPTCNTAVADAQLAPWKAMASKAGSSTAKENAVLAFDIANRTYNIMSAFYGGVGFGMGWGLLAAGYAAMGFDFIVPDTTDLAKRLYAQLTGSVSAMWAGIAADPPDPNFTTVAAPVFTPVDQVSADASVTALQAEYLNAFLDAQMRAEAYGTASRVANERYMGAVAAGDHAAAELQANAAADYSYELINQLRNQKIFGSLVAQFDWTDEPIVDPPGGADATTWWNDMLAHLDTLTAADLTSTDRQSLRDQGITDPQIDQIVALFSDPDFVSQAHALDPTATVRDAMDETLGGIDDTIATLSQFGSWMSMKGADEHAQAPTTPSNHAPVSAFSASKLSGAAPLTVTFTSQATDPDGDALSLHWDIAGTDTADGVAALTHTFTEPGTYGVSLVATDPDGEWHQAVKWITVYPDGVDPGGANKPPVAVFTPQLVDDTGPITQTFKSNSFDPDGDPITETWYFGDGTSATGSTVTKTFPPGYIMSVLLVVSDGTLTGQAAGEVTSRDSGGPPPGNPPTAAFTADPASGTSPLEVHFASTSSDPDGDAITETWYFGDGDTGTGSAATHTYAAAGTYTATLVVSDGTNSASATRTVTVDAVTPIHAAFDVGSGIDAAAAMNGARLLDTGVSGITNYEAVNVISPTSRYWQSANGVTSETLIVRLAGGGRDLLDRVVLNGVTVNSGVKTFSVALSRSSDPLGAYTTVIDHATLAQDNAAHSYGFAAQQARFLKLTVHDNYGGAYLRMTSLQAFGPGREATDGQGGGIVSMYSGVPATAMSATSVYDSRFEPANILQSDNSYWSSARNATSDQRIRVSLGGDGSHPISSVALRPVSSTASPKHFEVWASDSGADGDWTKVVDDTLASTGAAQTFAFASPMNARFVEVRFADNYGATTMGLYELRVLTANGLNVADGTGVGAAITDASIDPVGYPAANVLRPDTSNGLWQTPNGNGTEQYVTVLLRDDRDATIDRVSVRSDNIFPRNVDIQVSLDGVSFTTVASRQLINVNGDQTITFPPVTARFVKLLIHDGYSPQNIRVNRFRVYAADRGTGTAVPFVDTSTGTAPAVSWHWDFGDGATSTDQYPTHTFPGPGTYDVSLTVTNADGDHDTVTRPYVVPGLPEISLATSATAVGGETYNADEGTDVSLTASTDGIPAVAWDWDFDYTKPTATTSTVTAKFPDDGTYTVRYRALTSDWLWTPWRTATFHVANIAPTVDAGPPQWVYIGKAITPQVVTMRDRADSPNCTWDWGDGSPLQTIAVCTYENAVNVPHTYAVVGTYTATLTADDGDGGVTSSSVELTVKRYPTFLQILDVTHGASDLDATVRLWNAATGEVVPNVDVSVSADGSTPVDATTDADGIVHVTIPDATAAGALSAIFAGTAREDVASLTRQVHAPKADIIFVVDESGSMSGIQGTVADHLAGIVQGLGSSLDYRVGKVTYAGEDHGNGWVRQALTDDYGKALTSLQPRSASTDYANGYDGTVVAMGYKHVDGDLVETDAIGRRANAATCAVLVTDANVAEADYMIKWYGPDGPTSTYTDALRALTNRNASLFAITESSPNTKDAYGPGPGLAGQTGGDWWAMEDFLADPSGVLDALATKCVSKAQTPDLEAAIDGPADPVAPGDTVTYTVTGTNAAAIDTPFVTLSATLPAGVEFVSASGDGTYDPATRTVTWPTGDLNAGTDDVHTITAKVAAYDWEAGDHVRTASAEIHSNGALGPESDDANNHATRAVTVHVADPIGPEPSTTTTSTTTTTLPPTTTSTTSTTTSTTSTTTTLPPPTTSTTTTSTTTTLPPTTSTTTTSTSTVPSTTEPSTSTVPPSSTAPPTEPPGDQHPGTTSPPAVAVEPNRAGPQRTPAPDPSGELPRTGPASPIVPTTLFGFLLALLGSALVLRTRPRRKPA